MLTVSLSLSLSLSVFTVQDLMHLACTSVLCGGGTNQELAHHCLYECKGDIMVGTTEQSILTDREGASVINGNITGRSGSNIHVMHTNLFTLIDYVTRKLKGF